jgi:hypothetical protein
MASLKIGNWVEITGTPDYNWNRWSFNREYYDNFSGKFGIIKDIQPDYNDDTLILYKIGVDFEESISDGYSMLAPATYYEWFKSDHIILSSKFEAERKTSLYKAGEDLQIWEEFKRKSTNDALKSIFAPEPAPKKPVLVKDIFPKDIPSDLEAQDHTSWFMDSRSNNIDPEEYDINLLDFLNQNNPDFYSDD